MAVYDDQENDGLEARDLAEQESWQDFNPSARDAARHPIKTARDAKASYRNFRDTSGSQGTDAELEKLKGHIAGFKKGDDGSSNGSDEDGGGLFRKEGKKSGIAGMAGGLLGKKKIAGAAVGGIAGLIIPLVGIFGFLSNFRLDSILNNIDQKTFARFNAELDGRSDKYFKAYLRVRLMEREGAPVPTDENGNRFFRADRVDTNKPFTDWYKTLRTSKFEEDLRTKHGIVFTSSVGPDGRIRPAIITINGSEERQRLSPDLANNPGGNDPNLNSRLLQNLGDFQAQVFDGPERHKEARRAIRRSVNDNTKFYNVIKRRHLRKNIRNMTGISNWKFFERTRTKISDSYEKTRNDMIRKIVTKVYGDGSNNEKFVKCLLLGESCIRSSDPANPDNRASQNAPNGADPNLRPNDADYQPPDPNGSGQPGPPLGGPSDAPGSAAGEISGAIADAAGRGAAANDLANGPIKKFVAKMVSQYGTALGGGPVGIAAKAWPILKSFATIDGLFKGGGTSKVSNMVKVARAQQLMAFLAVTTVARDQIKSGDLIGDELTAFYEQTQYFERSEGWATLQNQTNGVAAMSLVSAQTSEDIQDASKEAYCADDYEPKFGEYAHMCDKYKPSDGGNAAALSKAYESSIGVVLGPIADAVNAIKKSIVGSLIDTVSGAVEGITTTILSPLIQAGNAALAALGVNIGEIVAKVMARLLTFMGAAPFIDPTRPGFANFLIAGSASTASVATRFAGGVKSTPSTAAYSNRLTTAYIRESKNSMSLYERYADVHNPDSIASSIALNASSIVVNGGSGNTLLASIFSSLTNTSTTMSSVLGGKAFAQATPQYDVEQLVGADRYDIPKACIELDPLDPAYESKATNAGRLDNVTIGLLRDDTAFWDAVFQKYDPDTEQATIDGIYNCAALDQQVMSGMGNIYGHVDDNGYKEGGDQALAATNASPTTTGGDPNTCAAGTKDLGVPTDPSKSVYENGNRVDKRLCALPNLKCVNSECTPGSTYYIEGADGNAIVSAEASHKFFPMLEAAKRENIPFIANSSFRTMAHQEQLCRDNSGCSKGSYKWVARPGTSNHQRGQAIDFGCGNGSFMGRGSACYAWLQKNAGTYGIKNLPHEAWHWSTTGK